MGGGTGLFVVFVVDGGFGVVVLLVVVGFGLLGSGFDWVTGGLLFYGWCFVIPITVIVIVSRTLIIVIIPRSLAIIIVS